MILFQDVIEVLHRSVLAVLLQHTLGFELHNRRRVSGMLVGVDDSRRRMVCSVEGWADPIRGPCFNMLDLSPTNCTLGKHERTPGISPL
jgi:hypothetical protein